MRELNNSFDYITKDYKGYKQAMIDRLKVLMPEYTDLSETDAGIVILELASMGLDILSAYLDSQANESLLVTANLWSSVLKWAKLLSYEPRFATSSTIEQVFKLKTASDTDTIIPAGTRIMTSNLTNETPVYFETVKDLTIPAGKLGDETDEESGKYLYTVDAIHGVSILGENIGSSNGAKDQEFKLSYSPVVYSTIEIWCDGIKWTKAENNSFVNSGSDDTHYTITMSDLNEAIIVFGDNVFGKIPPKDKPIYAYYRVGGGISGNVSPNTVTVLVESNSLIDSTFNPYLPKEYGQDRESLKSIQLAAPALSRTTWGALTLTDFSDIVTSNFPEIQLAKTIRGDFAATCGITSDTTCDDIVIGTVQSKIGHEFEEISQDLKDEILKEFETRKLAGMNEIKFIKVTEVKIGKVDAAISILYDYLNNSTEIVKKAKEAFIHYFDIGNLSIDETIIVGDIEKYIKDNVQGINAVRLTLPSNYYTGGTTDSVTVKQADNVALQLLTASDETLTFKATVSELGTSVTV